MTIQSEYLTVKEMIAVEMNSEYLGVSTLQLMENAGKSVADEVANRFDNKSKIAVAAGLSGNGGDAFVVARHLAAAGYPVEVIILGDPKNIRVKDTLVNWKALDKMKSSIKFTLIKDSSQIQPIKADVIIDGLIGTSMKGVLKPPFLQLVQVMNKSKSFKVSIDVPTGLEADTGIAKGDSVHADLTISFHKKKQGYKNNPIQLGDLKITNIGIPQEAEQFTGPGDVYLVNKQRRTNDHKGMYGTLLVIGGNETYSGAPSLTSMAAYAIGLDLVYTAVPESISQVVSGFSPSMITVKLTGNNLNQDNLKEIEPLLPKVDAVAIGPGIGLSHDTIKAVNKLLKMIQSHHLPCLIDADGLKAYAENKRKLKSYSIFTPHAKEFSILTGKEATGDFLEKGEIVKKEAEKLRAVILLKGPIDIISDGKYVRYNLTGNPGMTVGGTGDVLSGVTAGFLAQGTSPMNAACAGAFINGAAGDIVYKKKGYHILPEDIIDEIPMTIENALKNR